MSWPARTNTFCPRCQTATIKYLCILHTAGSVGWRKRSGQGASCLGETAGSRQEHPSVRQWWNNLCESGNGISGRVLSAELLVWLFFPFSSPPPSLFILLCLLKFHFTQSSHHACGRPFSLWHWFVSACVVYSSLPLSILSRWPTHVIWLLTNLLPVVLNFTQISSLNPLFP